ncbi:MAG TPA: TIGR01777 family protein [Colwellia sp.]|nr:TIGR01777 family protein [Colwellia sp.]
MHYLITGGTGLIGRAFIESLAESNSQITVLTRNKLNTKKILGNSINCIDDLEIDDIESSDIILNLAGEPIADKRWSDTQKDNICQSRWNITQHLVELISQAKNPPSVFISGSAIGIYGRQNKQPINESFEDFHHEFTHHVCSEWENIALSAATNKTRVAILRTGIVLAKKSGALGKMIPPFKLGLGGKIGDGEQMMSWIHLEDMVAAISHIEKNETLQGAINLTAPNPVNNYQFTHALASTLSRPCLLSTPPWLLKTLLGEMSDLLLFGQNVVPDKLTNSGFSFKYSKVEEALTNLIK